MWTVIPPMATQGTVISSFHQARMSGSACVGGSLVWEGKRPERHIVGAGFRRDHGQMTNIVTGHTDDGIAADNLASVTIGNIVLANVNAVAARLRR